MGEHPYLTVLMPAYNEEKCLRSSAEAVLAKLAELGIDGELLIVDDASGDSTPLIADGLACDYPNVSVFHHPVNLGIGGGFRTGMRKARGEWMILVPADLALDLDELPKYLEAAHGADLVVGISTNRRDYSWQRLLVSWVNIHAIQLLFGMTERQFNYISMYRMELLRRVEIECWRSAFFFAEAMIKVKALGGHLVEVNINYVPRITGHQTGASAGLVSRTIWDMLRFWVSWVFTHRKHGHVSRAGAPGRS